MANRAKAPQEVEAKHTALIQSAVLKMEALRAAAWEAELVMRDRIGDAFHDGMTVGPIKAATVTEANPDGLSTPRLYQIKKEQVEAASA